MVSANAPIKRQENTENFWMVSFYFSSHSSIAFVHKIEDLPCQHAVSHSFVRVKCERAKPPAAPPSVLQFFKRMTQYRLGMHTNAWNALRYSVIKLAADPLAEKLWSRFHSRRTGERVIRRRTARLRQSRLAHRASQNPLRPPVLARHVT